MIIYLILSLFGTPDTQEQYIKCNLLNAKICEIVFGVPTSIQLSQAIVESGGGKSNIAQTAKNHFGMKHFSNDEQFITSESGTKWKAFDTVFQGYWEHAKFLAEHYHSGCRKSAAHWANFKGYGGIGYWQYIHKVIQQKNLKKYDIHWN